MKYYIPTTSLNIDTILSTESISPQVFYAKRKFKPNLFERLFSNEYDNVILLFSRIPSFELNGIETEQYPIVLEIEDNQQLQDSQKVVSCDDFSIFSCNHTIYLTPWNTHIIVFDKRAYKHSQIVIESSRNCKIGSKFIWKLAEDSLPLDKMFNKIDILFGLAEKNDEMPINIVKGALWGHIIGLSRYKTPNAAKLLKLANEMRNITSNAISNNGVCKPIFYERLSILNEEYSRIADNKAYEHWSKECSSEEISILKKFHVIKEALLKFFKFHNYSISPNLPIAQSGRSEWIAYREKLSSYTQSFIQKESNFNLESINFDSFEFNNTIFSIKGYDLANEVLKKIHSGDITKELLRVNKPAAMKIILSAISSILRNGFGDEEWAKVPKERKYINALGKNIIDLEPFDINSINNYELISIAAYILKGEDYDALIRYLEDNGIGNYDIVFTLWGATEGYASIHKVLVSQYITPNILNMINAFVGIDSNGEFFPLQKPLDSGISIKQRDNTFIINSCEKEVNNSIQSDDKTQIVTPFIPSKGTANSEFDVFMGNLCTECKSASKDESIYKEHFYRYGLSTHMLEAIKNDKRLQKGKGAPKGVIKCIDKMLKTQKQKKSKERTNENPSLFNELREMRFQDVACFDDAKSYINEAIPMTIRYNLLENLKYIIKEYTGNGKYANTGEDPVKHYSHLCFSPSNRWNRIEDNSENRKYVEQICEILSGKRKDKY